MLLLNNVTLATFDLPADKVVGQAALKTFHQDAAEVWVAMYGFTNQDYGTLIKDLDSEGVLYHFLLDASQYVGHTEHPFVDALLKDLKHADATITCAGPGSAKPHIIMHKKEIVVRYHEVGREYGVWRGSVNFSGGGWDQANTIDVFASTAYVIQQFLPWFAENKAWAEQHVPQRKAGVEAIRMGLMRMSAGSVAAGPESEARLADMRAEEMEMPDNRYQPEPQTEAE